MEEDVNVCGQILLGFIGPPFCFFLLFIGGGVGGGGAGGSQ